MGDAISVRKTSLQAVNLGGCSMCGARRPAVPLESAASRPVTGLGGAKLKEAKRPHSNQ